MDGGDNDDGDGGGGGDDGDDDYDDDDDDNNNNNNNNNNTCSNKKMTCVPHKMLFTLKWLIFLPPDLQYNLNVCSSNCHAKRRFTAFIAFSTA